VCRFTRDKGAFVVNPEAQHRKERPLCTGVLDYFPDALLEVAHCSKVGSDQHNPGQPLHWAKEKSPDEPDALLRHLKDRGTYDTDGVRHSAKVAWRALAMLQREIEAERVPQWGATGCTGVVCSCGKCSYCKAVATGKKLQPGDIIPLGNCRP
jgi:hypothetical protein